jgi:hypothetical protein
MADVKLFAILSSKLHENDNDNECEMEFVDLWSSLVRCDEEMLMAAAATEVDGEMSKLAGCVEDFDKTIHDYSTQSFRQHFRMYPSTFQVGPLL